MDTQEKIIYVDDANMVAALRHFVQHEAGKIGAEVVSFVIERRPGDVNRFRVAIATPADASPKRERRYTERERLELEHSRLTSQRAQALTTLAKIEEKLADIEHALEIAPSFTMIGSEHDSAGKAEPGSARR